MRNIFLIIIISILLSNYKEGESKISEDSYSRFTYSGREYTLEEVGLPQGTQVKPIRGWYINGFHIIPKEIKHRGVVVTFGGSDGGSALMIALGLAYRGYEVYSMYSFGQENQRKYLDQVPLEFFAELCLHIRQNAKSPEPLTIYGSSRGAELALLLAGHYPDQVDNLILHAPSAYVFQGLKSHNSAWTFQGRELPYIAYDPSKEVTPKRAMDARSGKPLREVEVFRYGILYDKNKEKARINLSSIRANMLIFAGEKDEVWPSADMAREIKANYKGECELVTFEKAGHVFSNITSFRNMALGGDSESNVQAGIESDKIMEKKLVEWTK